MTLKTVIAGGVIFLLILLIKIFIVNDKGYYIGWSTTSPIYEYKSYSDKPSIDSKEFYDNVVLKKNEQGACRIILTQYRTDPIEDVQQLAYNGDTDAMMELVSRNYGNDYLNKPIYPTESDTEYIKKAAKKGNVYGKIEKLIMTSDRIDYEKFRKKVKKYENITPYAIATHEIITTTRADDVVILNKNKYYYVFEKDMDKRKEYKNRLRYAINYPYGLAIGSLYEEETVDNDMFCEAYFKGCNLYYLKNKLNINCS